jgi:hypothetical protein
MNKNKKPSPKSTAKGRKPSGKKEPIRDLDLSELEARRVKGGRLAKRGRESRGGTT